MKKTHHSTIVVASFAAVIFCIGLGSSSPRGTTADTATKSSSSVSSKSAATGVCSMKRVQGSCKNNTISCPKGFEKVQVNGSCDCEGKLYTCRAIATSSKSSTSSKSAATSSKASSAAPVCDRIICPAAPAGCVYGAAQKNDKGCPIDCGMLSCGSSSSAKSVGVSGGECTEQGIASCVQELIRKGVTRTIASTTCATTLCPLCRRDDISACIDRKKAEQRLSDEDATALCAPQTCAGQQGQQCAVLTVRLCVQLNQGKGTETEVWSRCATEKCPQQCSSAAIDSCTKKLMNERGSTYDLARRTCTDQCIGLSTTSTSTSSSTATATQVCSIDSLRVCAKQLTTRGRGEAEALMTCAAEVCPSICSTDKMNVCLRTEMPYAGSYDAAAKRCAEKCANAGITPPASSSSSSTMRCPMVSCPVPPTGCSYSVSEAKGQCPVCELTCRSVSSSSVASATCKRIECPALPQGCLYLNPQKDTKGCAVDCGTRSCATTTSSSPSSCKRIDCPVLPTGCRYSGAQKDTKGCPVDCGKRICEEIKQPVTEPSNCITSATNFCLSIGLPKESCAERAKTTCANIKR